MCLDSDSSVSAADEDEDPLDPHIFHYFSGAHCEPPTSLQRKTIERRALPQRRSAIQRVQSDLMPVISEATTDTAANTCTFQPDPTCADVPDDILLRTRSASAVLDYQEDSSIEVRYTGFGYYRRPTNASPDWMERTMRPRVEELGPAVAHRFGFFEMAGIKPIASDPLRAESFNSWSSQKSSPSQYSEISDEQGRITKVYKGFGASAATTSTLHLRNNSVPSCSKELYSRQTVQVKARRSFITHPESPGEAKGGGVCDERSTLTAHNKTSNTLDMGSPSKRETAIESDDEDWEEENPETRGKPISGRHRRQESKASISKNIVTDKGAKQNDVASEKPKQIISRRPLGAKICRVPSRRTNSSEKVPKAKVQHQQPTDCTALPPTVQDHVPNPQELDTSTKSEAELKREEALANLKSDDDGSVGSASTAQTSPGMPGSLLGGHRDRSRTASQASYEAIPHASEVVQEEEEAGSACP